MYFNSSKGAWFQGSPGFVPTWLCDVWWKSTGKPRDPNETWCFRRKGHTPKKTPLVQSSRKIEIEGLDEGSRSFADYLRTSAIQDGHVPLRRAPGLFNTYLQGSESSALLRGMCPSPGLEKKWDRHIPLRSYGDLRTNL